MKELTIKEKAQRYDEAIKVAENIHRFSSDPAEIKRIEQIFPSLQESEDERIRKALVDALNKNLGNGIEKYGTTLNAALAWLEKQGEQKSEWNEEDKQYFNFLEKLLENLQVKSTENEIKKGTTNNSEYYYKVIQWLKSIKPQKQWNPSEEQIKALGAAQHGNYFDVHILDSLFHDLEQLKQL